MKLESSSIKKADIQMSEAFVTSVFLACPEVFRMHTLILRGRKYSQMHRLETSY